MELSRKWQFIFTDRARRFKTPHDISHWTEEGFKIRFRSIGREIRKLVKPDSNVIDIGSGPGFYSELLNNPVLLDYAPAVFSRTPPNITARKCVGSLQNLPFRNNSFDGLLCIGVLQCMDLKREHIIEAARILKPGGWFIFETLNAECRELFEDLNKRDIRKLKNYLDSPDNSDSHILYDDFSLYHADRLSAKFRECGLGVFSVKWMYPYTFFPRLQMRKYAKCFYLWGRRS